MCFSLVLFSTNTYYETSLSGITTSYEESNSSLHISPNRCCNMLVNYVTLFDSDITIWLENHHDFQDPDHHLQQFQPSAALHLFTEQLTS